MGPPRRSTEAELDAFDLVCERLSGFGVAVDPEWADGLLTAFVTGPVRPGAERWLEALAGDAFERAFADPPDRAQARAALDARIAAIESALDVEALLRQPQELRLDPVMREITDEDRAQWVAKGLVKKRKAAAIRTGLLWAEGFLTGADSFAPDWGTPTLGNSAREQYLGLISQIDALLIEPGSEDAREFAALHYPRGLPPHDRLIGSALFAAQDLRLFWLDHGPRPPPRRVESPPGRNDPCPCGSGRKFKKCHGAEG
jgi:uncharacterized protein